MSNWCSLKSIYQTHSHVYGHEYLLSFSYIPTRRAIGYEKRTKTIHTLMVKLESVYLCLQAFLYDDDEYPIHGQTDSHTQTHTIRISTCIAQLWTTLCIVAYGHTMKTKSIRVASGLASALWSRWVLHSHMGPIRNLLWIALGIKINCKLIFKECSKSISMKRSVAVLINRMNYFNLESVKHVQSNF